ncbi:hypothetical protein DFQ11_10316 [Winogradskyella epiphytica]|uniref:Uncharacterized protein n=1 Tax=Winogradskyella epiphytica TaxID=262005 RepID=A0A2V4WVG9_9FLAO|nr:hypothetical protein [Winogradskyella epiphytica]PYE80936.1 hypothetical protein DFQ11_10316 [Winogradskyella epiphytica]GGW65650.1 hypothetical protein GCM10008085_16800 [Winogradskyella epiphytica]
MNTVKTKRDFNWLIATFISLTGLGIVELFEQITYVTNWLVGDIVENAENFRKFHHVVDAGVFHFPTSTIVLIGFIGLVIKKSGFMQKKQDKKIVWKAFIAFLITYGISVYIITFINVPVFSENIIPAEQIPSKLKLWGILNAFRVILPAYAVYQLTKLFRLKENK